jgi:hypothetical protein
MKITEQALGWFIEPESSTEADYLTWLFKNLEAGNAVRITGGTVGHVLDPAIAELNVALGIAERNSKLDQPNIEGGGVGNPENSRRRAESFREALHILKQQKEQKQS